jgi:drug/metabolite transporter (DMT)-like permease
MSTERLEKLIWVLIYGGLLLLSLGWFVRQGSVLLGALLMIVGAAFSATGAVLVWVRSKRPK